MATILVFCTFLFKKKMETENGDLFHAEVVSLKAQEAIKAKQDLTMILMLIKILQDSCKILQDL